MSSLRTAVDCEAQHVSLNTDEPIKLVPPTHTWIDHLYERVTVASASKGRIRFHLDFQGDEILLDSLRRELQRLATVRLASYSVRTGNALVTFDPKAVTEVEITVALLKGVREFARMHGDCDLAHHFHSRRGKNEHSHEEECDHEHPVTDAGIRKELFKLVATGGALGYFLYKRVKNPIVAPESPLSLATFITIASGYPIFRDGMNSVRKKGKATDDTLIGIAVGASLLLGESLTGLSVVWLIQLGRILELITLKRSRTAVKELMDLTPTEAWLVDGATDSAPTKRITVEEVQKGQILRVFHGEKVALDGKIVRGTGLLKESFLTGEAVPKEKTLGDVVYAGSVLEAGEIDVEVTNLAHDTVVATMIDAIENLRDNKAPIEKVGAKFASKFVPISIGISVATLIVTRDIRRAITMLVIACPCAAGLATPTAVSASIGQIARKGVLIKGGAHLETAARVDTILFDKTGTLTLGRPVLHEFVGTDAGEKLGIDECLRLAASSEQYTTHPLGQVLVSEAKLKKLKFSSLEDYLLHEGLGVSATVDGKKVLVGNQRFMAAQKVKITKAAEAKALGSVQAGSSLMYLAVDGKLHGVFVVEDQVRPDVEATLERLRKMGVKRFIMATGDQRATAEHIAKKVGITEVHAELMPQGKLDLVQKLKKEGRKVAMMGDGVNDAQALAEADLSIAMGASRCDVAIETADVTIAREDFQLVGELFDVSRKTLRTIYQNFVAAVGINAGGMVYSATGQLSPFSAAIVHNASTLAVVVNSLRLGRTVAGDNPLKVLREVTI